MQCPAPRLYHETASLLTATALLAACLPTWPNTISSAHGEEQAAAAVSAPASVPRGWIEPTAAAEPAPSPTSAASNRPATLRHPDDARPLRGQRIPDPPAAASFDARLVSSFTSGIQPLLLNRCATGNCHGGTDAAAPQFQRQLFRGNIDRHMTLANIDALTSVLRPDFDARRLLLAASTPHGGSNRPPLSNQQLHTLALWINAALAQQATWGQAELASFETPVPASSEAPRATGSPVSPAQPTLESNRFQQMLDNAANPQPLPPPQEPAGIIPLEELPEAQPSAK
jgi:hypothetical protein